MRNENNTTLSISLTEIMMEYVQDRVADGTYTSISDYVRDLIRADMERANKLANLRRLVNEGLHSLESREGVPFDRDEAKAKAKRSLDKILSREKYIGSGPEPSEEELLDKVTEYIHEERRKKGDISPEVE
jgi:antitoxin ParD1/3/4